jgi:shikimate kinase
VADEAVGIRRVVLVGLMASGKSTVAARVAVTLGWEHIDLDREIELAAGLSVAEIFRTRGEDEFRRMENEATGRLLERVPAVWSPGGGWGAAPGRLASLGPGTLSVWLRVSPEAVLERAGLEPGTRPLLRAADPLVRITDLLREREPFYRLADLAVETTGRNPEAVAGDVLNAIRSYGPAPQNPLQIRNA